MNQTKKIDIDFCFKPNKDITATDTYKALAQYASNYQEAKNLNGDIIIFLDTNILLGFYGMSKEEKDKLLKFFERYKDKIIITKQVEKEFLRNRLSTINKDFFSPLNEVIKDFDAICKDIKNKLLDYKNKKKKILSQDFPDLWDNFREIEEKITSVLDDEEFYKEIKARINETTQNNENLAILDDLLKILAGLKLVDKLDENEIGFIRHLYSGLLEDYKNSKESIRYRYTFPGCGEKKELDREGDFIIYHEILKYMHESDKSCILLTKDLTKGDWLQNNRYPHNHYIENTYFATRRTLYIVDAEEALNGISFENIHNEPQNKDINIGISILPEQDQDQLNGESTIITIDKKRGYGFIYAKNGNLFFTHADVVDGIFNDLSKDDIVEFNATKNNKNNNIATNVRKINYSFDNSNFVINTSKIAHIKPSTGIGFISYLPENLYFHESFFNSEDSFTSLKKGDEVEFIIGKNAEGESIARLVREKLRISNHD